MKLAQRRIRRPVASGIETPRREAQTLRVAAALAVILLWAPPAAGQWRLLPTTDDVTDQRTVMALSEGAHGQLRMLTTCEEGFYILAIGFPQPGRILANGSFVIQWGETGPVERHAWSLDDDGEVAYVTTWPGTNAGDYRYDRVALAFFENLRRHAYLTVWATERPATNVADQFWLTGAAQALDGLNCPHR